MILPALLAKFLSAGAVAQAATGAGVVVVAFTGVGAVGALPAPAQETFSTVVAAVTPAEDSTAEEVVEDTDGTSEETAPDTVPVLAPEDSGTESAEAGATEPADFDVAAWALAGPAGYDSHGAWVSESAENPDLRAALKKKGVSFGAVVSGWANGKGVDEDVLAALGVESGESADVPGAEQPTDATPVAPVVEPTDSGSAAAESGTRGNSGKQAGNAQGQPQPQGQGQAKSNAGGNGRGNG